MNLVSAAVQNLRQRGSGPRQQPAALVAAKPAPSGLELGRSTERACGIEIGIALLADAHPMIGG
jgi:hypothetical protein